MTFQNNDSLRGCPPPPHPPSLERLNLMAHNLFYKIEALSFLTISKTEPQEFLILMSDLSLKLAYLLTFLFYCFSSKNTWFYSANVYIYSEVYIPQMVQVSFPGTIPGVPVFFPDFFTGSTNI